MKAVSAVALSMIASAGNAFAETEAAQSDTRFGFGQLGAVPHRFNLRVGSTTTDTVGRPAVCADVRIVGRFGVEACGTAPGLLHNQPGREMSHYRGTAVVAAWQLPRGDVRLRGHLGFAELALGDDRIGFQFGDPDPEQQSVAGPEVGWSAQWIIPAWNGLDIVGNAAAGVAYMSGAGALAEPQREWQTFVSFEFGVGF